MRSLDEFIAQTLMRDWLSCWNNCSWKSALFILKKRKQMEQLRNYRYYSTMLKTLWTQQQKTINWTRQNGKQIIWNWAIFTSYVQLLYTFSIHWMNEKAEVFFSLLRKKRRNFGIFFFNSVTIDRNIFHCFGNCRPIWISPRYQECQLVCISVR